MIQEKLAKLTVAMLLISGLSVPLLTEKALGAPRSPGNLSKIHFNRSFCRDYEKPNDLIVLRTRIGNIMGIDGAWGQLTTDFTNAEGWLFDRNYMLIHSRTSLKFNMSLPQYWVLLAMQPHLKNRYRQTFGERVIDPTVAELTQMGVTVSDDIKAAILKRCSLTFTIKSIDGRLFRLKRDPRQWTIESMTVNYRALPFRIIDEAKSLDELRDQGLFGASASIVATGDDGCESAMR